jgi:hypothetical protein
VLTVESVQEPRWFSAAQKAVSRNRVELYFGDWSLVNYQQGSGLGKIVIKRSQ